MPHLGRLLGRNRHVGWPLAAALTLALVAAGCGTSASSRSGGSSADPRVEAAAAAQLPPPPGDGFRARIERVVDGDTVIARVAGRGARLRVRLIGVDTPETVRQGTPVRCFGPEASAYMKRLLSGAWVIAAHERGGDTDRYGRQLWDVWLDGRLVAGLLVADGFGRAYPVRPQTRYAAVLKSLERRARSARRGLWGKPCRGRSFGQALSRRGSARQGP